MADSEFRFTSIYGQKKPIALLREAAEQNKLAHAYLFRGPDGIGKKKTALTLAAYLNCQNPLQQDACGHCASCRKYAGGNHPDLILVQPDGAAIKISQIRELKHTLTFPPLEARLRMIILEDIHTMRREAANSLLKTLEEPAPGNLLVLTADQRGEVLPTILSRCQIIPFGPLDHKAMVQLLMREEGMDESTAFTLAAVSEGSLGRAIFLWQENLLSLRQEVIEKLLLGQFNRPETIGLILQLSEKLATLKENLSEFLDLLRLWYRDLILLAAGGPPTSITNKDLQDPLQETSHHLDISRLHEKLRCLDKAEKQLHRNCSSALVLETLFFDLI